MSHIFMSTDQPDAMPTQTGNPTDTGIVSFDVNPGRTVIDAPAGNKLPPDDNTIDENSLQIRPVRETFSATPISTPLQQSQESKYHLLNEIARGGMGLVMEARDTSLRRGVAMKVMLDPRTASKQRILRFTEEARITAQLQHPGIVPIYELGTDQQGNVFYTMKRVAGRTLKDILAKLKEGDKQTETDFPLNRLLTILLRVCDAVAYAHSQGIVHRDLKPENIMIGEYGEVLVLDWGLAKVLKRDEVRNQKSEVRSQKSDPGPLPPDLSPQTSDLEPLLTMEGNAIGTPGYMAPEQARGQVARMDEKSDIYSLGAILYHILKLEPTVGSSKTTNRNELLEQIKTGKIAPLKKNRRIPEALIAVTAKALSLRPKDRYRTVKLFQTDIESYLNGFATSAEELSVGKLVTMFILRHKTTATFLAILLSLLATGYIINYKERLKAEKAQNAALESEKKAQSKSEQTEQALSKLKATAPALLSLVDFHIRQQEIEKAMSVVDRATELVPESPDCHIKRGHLFQITNKFKDALTEYRTALQLEPSNKTALTNIDLCGQMLKTNDIHSLSSALLEQNRSAEAAYLIRSTVQKQKPDKIQFLLKWILEQEKIQFKDILIENGRCILDLSDSNIYDLSLLNGIPLASLNLTGCMAVYDLRPIRYIPLESLTLTGTGVADLSPLKGLPLNELNLSCCTRITSLAPLKGMPLQRLNLAYIGSAMSQKLKTQPDQSLKELSSDDTSASIDLSPLNQIHLTELDLSGWTQISDLAFLKHMPLTTLKIRGCEQITDLSPLKNMPLTRLDISGCVNITDITPLKHKRLVSFELAGTGIRNGTVLRTMPVARFLGK